MSKRALKKYLFELDKNHLEEQLLNLYDKFPDVKTYYDFVFNPKEEKLLQEAKGKISNEYFPIKSKRAKLRRSTAQKYIKHFLLLGVDPFAIADLMLYAIEVGQRYSSRREMRYASFYKSMHNSFEQVVNFIITQGLVQDFETRITYINTEVVRQNWANQFDFEKTIEKLVS